MIQTCKNFDLRIRGSVKTGYTVEASVLAGGSVLPQPLALPSDEDFELRLDGVLNQTTDDESLQTVGEALFDAMFPARIVRLWASTQGSLKEEEGVRIRLRIEPPELMNLPWELIFEDEYLGLRLRYPIVRYLDLPDPPRPIVVRPPLRVLVAVSQPKDTPRIGVDVELASIRKALQQLTEMVKVDVFDPARRDGLLATLRQGYHVLHFIGHGKFENDEGYLLLEDSQGHADQVSASLLGQIVADSNLRLVVLNACETSVAGPDRAFSGVAHQLVRSGMPAVVAMQQTIADQSSLAFTRELYGALSDGWPVDSAVQEGRRSIMAALGNGWKGYVDWAIPTLYMRAPDGVILKVRTEESEEVDKNKESGSGGDNTQITIGNGARNVAAGKNVRQTTYETVFHGPVHGPVHTGSGDIQIEMFHVAVQDLHLHTQDVYGLSTPQTVLVERAIDRRQVLPIAVGFVQKQSYVSASFKQSLSVEKAEMAYHPWWLVECEVAVRYKGVDKKTRTIEGQDGKSYTEHYEESTGARKEQFLHRWPVYAGKGLPTELVNLFKQGSLRITYDWGDFVIVKLKRFAHRMLGRGGETNDPGSYIFKPRFSRRIRFFAIASDGIPHTQDPTFMTRARKVRDWTESGRVGDVIIGSSPQFAVRKVYDDIDAFYRARLGPRFDELRDFECTINPLSITLVCLPLWRVGLKYRNHIYNLWIDANNAKVVSAEVPIGATRMATECFLLSLLFGIPAFMVVFPLLSLGIPVPSDPFGILNLVLFALPVLLSGGPFTFCLFYTFWYAYQALKERKI